MEFQNEGHIMGAGGSRDGLWILAIIFVIALVFLAVFKKDGRETSGLESVLATLIASKGMNGGDYATIKEEIQHSEDRAVVRQTQQEIGTLGKENLVQFGDIKEKLGMLSAGLAQVLQTQNNANIINGVIQQLAGMPCKA